MSLGQTWLLILTVYVQREGLKVKEITERNLNVLREREQSRQQVQCNACELLQCKLKNRRHESEKKFFLFISRIRINQSINQSKMQVSVSGGHLYDYISACLQKQMSNGYRNHLKL